MIIYTLHARCGFYDMKEWERIGCLFHADLIFLSFKTKRCASCFSRIGMTQANTIIGDENGYTKADPTRNHPHLVSARLFRAPLLHMRNVNSEAILHDERYGAGFQQLTSIDAELSFAAVQVRFEVIQQAFSTMTVMPNNSSKCSTRKRIPLLASPQELVCVLGVYNG